MKQNPFKAGDRVRVYGAWLPFQGALLPSVDAEIIDIKSYGWIECIYNPDPSSTENFSAHPKQCRRLVKKKRREWWIKNSDLWINSKLDDDGVCSVKPSHPENYIHVSEVRKK